MGNIETVLVDWFNADTTLQGLQLEASTEVPKKRPDRFVTVERTGGPESRFTGSPMLAIQVWAKHRHEAGDFAAVVARSLRASTALPVIGRVDVLSVANFPDPDSRANRYQITVEIVTKFD
ncbi:hypothetical protein [Glutamicibacter creatinolyticus]|uniref:hypothetical protein n=1 Tax=Glutamicibacter creatinolyticus TaxID=162496 RepID=UPI003218061B